MSALLVFGLLVLSLAQETPNENIPQVFHIKINDSEIDEFNVVRRQKPFLPVNKRDVREGRVSAKPSSRTKRVPAPTPTPRPTPTPAPTRPPPTPKSDIKIPTIPARNPDDVNPIVVDKTHDEQQAKIEKELKDAVNQAAKRQEQEPRKQTEDVKKAETKFEIVRVLPTTLTAKGGQRVTIEMSENVVGVVYCRFNDHVVAGRHLEDGKLVCTAPAMSGGEVKLAVSRDKTKWSRDVVLSVEDDSELPWGLVAIGGIAVIGVSLLAVKMLCWKRRIPKRRSGDGIMSNVDPLEIKSRGSDRKERLHHRRPQDNIL